MSSEERILVIKLSSLGDLFHALPAVHLIKQHTGVAVDWVTQPEYTGLVECFTDVDRVIEYPRRACLSRGGAFFRTLRGQHYSLGLDLQGLLKSATILRAARCGQRIGPARSREGARLFYTRTYGAGAPRRHAVEHLLDLADFLGAPCAPVCFPVDFPSFDLGLPGPVVGLAPRSRWPAKDWPAERFIEVAAELQQRSGCSICLVGGPGDREVCDRIAAPLKGPVRSLAGDTSLVQLGGAIRGMNLLLSVDSGPMHMAAAAGTPVLALFGVTDPARTGPYGIRTRTLLSPDLADHPRLARAFKDHHLHGRWDLPAGQVVEAALEMLADPLSPEGTAP